MTCAGETTWQGFAQAIVDEAAAADLLGGRRPEVAPIPSAQYPTPARRPTNSVLNNGKLLRQFGVAFPIGARRLVQAMSELIFHQDRRRVAAAHRSSRFGIE